MSEKIKTEHHTAVLIVILHVPNTLIIIMYTSCKVYKRNNKEYHAANHHSQRDILAN